MRLANLTLLLPLLLDAVVASAIPKRCNSKRDIVARNNGGGGHGQGWDNDQGWNKDHDGHGWNKDHDHDHDKDHEHDHDHDHDDGHDNPDCGGPDGPSGPSGTNDTTTITTWIEHNPEVNTNLTLPETVNNGTQVDLVDEGVIPTTNRTVPLINNDLPSLLNGSNPATSLGGLNVSGMNASWTPPQGTFKNSLVFDFTAARALAFRPDRPVGELGPHVDVAVGSQPDPPAPNPDPMLACEYKYEHVLGGNGTVSKGALWALEGYVDLVAADVKQGGIGDCGLGASIMALAAGGWTPYIKKMFVKQFDGNERNIVANFHKDGTVYPVTIDDQLPVLQNANAFCWPYPGYQPVNDAADPGPNGNYPPTPIFFMPLFEKAYAKFLDRFPEWSASPAAKGYAGLEGAPPHYVLAAITGGTPKATGRTRTGFDGPLLAALVTCMTGKAPCVIGTTNATTLEGLGAVDAYKSIWLNPAGDDANPKGYTPGTTSGLLASDAPKSEHTYSIVDFDQVIKTPDGDRSTAITMVGNHAYAFDWQASTHVPIPTGLALNDWRVSVLNPWGANPNSWPGGGGGGGGDFYNPAQVLYSFRTFAETVVGVYTVESMPPL